MSMDKDRAVFEAMSRRFGVTEDQLRQDEDGCYLDKETQSHWVVFGIGWAESRAAVAIELPNPAETLAGPTLYAQFKEAVEASGATVKVLP